MRASPIGIGFYTLTAVISSHVEILRHIHFPFSILRLSFDIAARRAVPATTNDKRKMENGKWNTIRPQNFSVIAYFRGFVVLPSCFATSLSSHRV
jgi:hypothetical protein